MLALVPAPAAAASELISAVSVGTTPFSPNGDGIRDQTRLKLTLTENATVSVSVRDFDGITVRRLVSEATFAAGDHRVAWNGRNDAGRLVPDGPYRFELTATGSAGTETARPLTAKATRVPYAAAPGAITIAIDAGHGGRYSGAYYGGVEEGVLNLDIAMRLRDMLRAAGVAVVMTREANVLVNDPPWDRNGDGVVNRYDNLAAKNDVANLARADLFVAIHNNATGCHCRHGTVTFYDSDRPWAPANLRWATLAGSELVEELSQYGTAAWPMGTGAVRVGDYYGLRGYQAGFEPRPTLMPAMLGESLYMDQPAELELLKRPDVRTSIAVGYFNAIARYLSKRPYGLRYEALAAPEAVTAGEAMDVKLRLTNRGNATSAGWRLELRYVPAVPLYDGSPEPGTILAAAPVPDGLAPGEATTVDLSGVPPPPPGEWLLKAGVVLPDGTPLSDRGVAVLQLPLVVQ